jgi:hypothetical protein
MNTMAYVRIAAGYCEAIFLAGCLLAGAVFSAAGAATREEIDRCRGIEQRAERLDCFKALKRNKSTKTESAAPVDAQSTSSTKTEDGLPAKTGEAPASNAAPVSKPDAPASTGAVSRVNGGSGRPLCVDRDALAGMLVAGLLTADPERAATPGCQTLPADAKLQIVQRYPGVFPFMRMVGVKVISATRPDLTGGFTLEVDAITAEGSPPKASQ